MEIGGHTVKHPILLSLSEGDAHEEIAKGRAELESILGESIAGFAYPNGRPGGDYDDRHAAMVERQGFAYAVSTRWATCSKESDRFQLPRVAPWGSSAMEFGLRTALAYRDR
jgi:peptidoglycan/xylan/chitin deacetylase (PgdA/CDA1 family)